MSVGTSHPVSGERPSQDLATRVANRLRQAIAEGELPPGTRLVEARIARDLQISRAPVREAARLLESEGLVVSVSGRGFFVRQITIRELEEVYEVRVCIERHAVAQAAALGGAALRPDLETALAAILRAAETGATSEQIAADFHFHRLIVAASDNRVLLRIFDEIAVDLRRVIGLIGEASADWRAIADSHRPVIEAVASGDADAAVRAMDEHIHLSWDATLTKIRRAANAAVVPIPDQAPMPSGFDAARASKARMSAAARPRSRPRSSGSNARTKSD